MVRYPQVWYHRVMKETKVLSVRPGVLETMGLKDPRENLAQMQ